MPRPERWTYGLDWNLLRTFMVIAEERSVSRAAARLLLQQPSVSAALRRLEESCGCRLVGRDKRPLTLTAQGELVYAECRDLFNRIAGLESLMATAPEGISGLVRLRAVPQIVNDEYDGIFRRMAATQPGIALQIETANSEQIVRAVAQQILPFGFCLLAKPIAPLSCRFMLREAFGIFAWPGHKLRGRRDLTLDSIKGERWVTYTAEFLEPLVALRLAAGAERIAVATSTPFEILRFIAAGAGIGILPLAAAREDVRAGRLWQMPLLHRGELGADLYFVSHPGAQDSPAEAAFRAEVTRTTMTEDFGYYLDQAAMP